MKIKIIIIITLLLFVLTSCQEDVATNSYTSLMIPNDGDFLISSKVWDEYWIIDSDKLTDHRNSFQAIFSENNDFVDVDNVKNQFFSLEHSNAGQYSKSYSRDNIYPDTEIYNWTVENYNNSNSNFKQNLVPRLKVISPLKTDTVSKSGFDVAYSGHSDAEKATITLYQASSINEEMGIYDKTDPELTPIVIRFTDDGSISLNSNQLSKLIPNRYYRFYISHSQFDTVNVSNKTGILYSSSTTSQYLYLEE